MTNREPELGDKVRDKISGFEGIITTHSKHLAGCDRFWITPAVDGDNKVPEGHWQDIDMVEVIEPNAVEVVKYTRKAPGGVDLPNSKG